MGKNSELFSTTNPLGITVTCYTGAWYGHITLPGKHQNLINQKQVVKNALKNPDVIFESTHPDRYVYFKEVSTNSKIYTKVVTERTDPCNEAVITAFTTKKISGGISNEIFHI